MNIESGEKKPGGFESRPAKKERQHVKDNPKVRPVYREKIELISSMNLSVAEAEDLVRDLVRQLAEIQDMSELIAEIRLMVSEGGK